MKWWGWLLLGLVAGIALVILWRGSPDDDAQRLRELVAADSLRSLQADSLIAALRLRVDSVSRETAVATEEAERWRVVAVKASEGHEKARQAAQEARSRLEAARTIADSVPALVGALRAETERAEAAESLLGATRSQLEATGRIVAGQRSVIAGQDSMLGLLRADRDRYRDRLGEAMTIIGRYEGQRRGVGNALAKGAETAAIGAATVGACRQGALTLGCVAGAVAVVVRVL